MVPFCPGSHVTPNGTLVYNGENGYAGIITATFNFDDVPVNTYEVTLSLNSDYYRLVDGASVFTVYDPSLGFTSGGGWFYWPGTTDKTNFGYIMEYGKKGVNVKGSVLIIRHTEDGIYRIKSNALDSGGLAMGTLNEMAWASFSGKCTYSEPGWAEPVGNTQFIVYVEDWYMLGGIDKFWINCSYTDSGLSMVKPATDNSVEIGGGNIFVPHTTSRTKK